jgi:hypothetical protein
MDNHVEHISDRIDNDVSLPAPDLLTSVVAPRPTNFGGFDALAVDNRRSWFVIAAPLGAFLLAQSTVDPASRAVETPLSAVVIDAVGIWEVVWKMCPLATGAQNVENRVDDLTEL